MLFDSQILSLKSVLESNTYEVDWQARNIRAAKQTQYKPVIENYWMLSPLSNARFSQFLKYIRPYLVSACVTVTNEQNSIEYLDIMCESLGQVDRWSYVVALDTFAAWKSADMQIPTNERQKVQELLTKYEVCFAREFVECAVEIAQSVLDWEKHKSMSQTIEFLGMLRDNLTLTSPYLSQDHTHTLVNTLIKCREQIQSFAESARESLENYELQYSDVLRDPAGNLVAFDEALDAGSSTEFGTLGIGKVTRFAGQREVAGWDMSICKDLEILEHRDRVVELEACVADLHMKGELVGDRWVWTISVDPLLNAIFNDPYLVTQMVRIEEKCADNVRRVWNERNVCGLRMGLEQAELAWKDLIGVRLTRQPYIGNEFHQIVLLHTFFVYAVSGYQAAEVGRSMSLLRATLGELDRVLPGYETCDPAFGRHLIRELKFAGIANDGIKIGDAYHISKAYGDAAKSSAIDLSEWLRRRGAIPGENLCAEMVSESTYDLHRFGAKVSLLLRRELMTDFALALFSECGYVVKSLVEMETEDVVVADDVLSIGRGKEFAHSYSEFRRITEGVKRYDNMIANEVEKLLVKARARRIGSNEVVNRLKELVWPQVMKDIVICRLVLCLSERHTTASELARVLGYTDESDKETARGGLAKRLTELEITAEVRKDPTKHPVLNKFDQDWIVKHRLRR